MSDVEQMSDAPTPHARIWLTPPCCGNYEHGEVTWCEDAANECGNCGAQPTEYLHSALAPVRAAEILAAEANERARIAILLEALVDISKAAMIAKAMCDDDDREPWQMIADRARKAIDTYLERNEHGAGK